MASASTQSANEPAKDFILVHTVQLKPMIKAQNLRWNGIGVRDVAFASVHSEKIHLKKCLMIMIIIIILNKSQDVMVFSGRQKLTSAMKIKARKVMVDFKFDALYRYIFIEGLQKSG